MCVPRSEDESQLPVELTNFMLVLASRKQNEASVMAHGNAYLIALEGIPAWAVSAAIHSWHQGDCGTDERGERYDYTWWPAPAVLRRIASRELWRVKDRVVMLRKLLRAVPAMFTDEHCARMRARVQELGLQTG